MPKSKAKQEALRVYEETMKKAYEIRSQTVEKAIEEFKKARKQAKDIYDNAIKKED